MFVLFFLISFKINAKENINIVLISIDTLRPAFLGFMGKNPSPSPFLDILSKKSVVFNNAITPVPLTLPAHCSVFTGLYPNNHRIRDNGRGILENGMKTIATFLKSKGYQTGAVIGSYVLSSRFGLSKGFDIYDDLVYKDGKEKIIFSFQERDASVVKENSLKIYNSFDKSKPFFLFIHFFDVHAPYLRHYNLKDFSEYEEEILYVDKAIKSLFEKIEDSNTLWIIFSDHGEAFGEHNEHTHGFLTYNTTLNVLLMFYSPTLFKPIKVDQRVSLIDIFPTILDIFQEKENCDGISLFPLIKGENLRKRNLLFESYYSAINFGTLPIYGVFIDNFKIIFPEPLEIYDLRKDMVEVVNIFEEKKDLAEKAKDLVKKIIENPKIEIADREALKVLKSLGYLSRGKPQEIRNISPKKAFNLYKKILKDRENYLKGISKFPFESYQKFLEQFPGAAFISLELGMAYFKYKDLESALKWMLYTLENDPELIEGWHNLGNLYYLRNEIEKAEETYKKVIELDEDFPYSYLSLGKIYYDKNQKELAFKMWDKFIHLCPKDENVKNIKKLMRGVKKE